MHVMCAICYTRFANVLCTHLQAANAGQRRRGYIHGYRLRVYSVGWETTKTKDDVWWGRRMRGYLAGLFTSIGGNAWHDRSSFAWMPLKASKMAAFLYAAPFEVGNIYSFVYACVLYWCTSAYRYRKHANSVRLFSLQSLRMAASAVCVWSYYEFCLVGLLFIGRAKSCYRLRIGLPCAGQGCMRKYIILARCIQNTRSCL